MHFTRSLALIVLLPLAAVHTDELADRSYGDEFPMLLIAADPGERWVVACEAPVDTDGDGELTIAFAREGGSSADDLRTCLFKPGGGREVLDEFIASTRGGRHLLVKVDGNVILIDTWSDERLNLTALGADSSDPDPTTDAHPTLGFSPSGTRVTYTRVAEGKATIVVRTLESGHEDLVEVSDGLLWRVHFSVLDHLVLACVVTEDTDGNGKLELPHRYSNYATRHCRGPVRAHTVFAQRGDEPEYWAACPGESRLTPAPDFAAPIAGGYLKRGEDGGICARLASGAEKGILPGDPRPSLIAVRSLTSVVLAFTPGSGEDGKGHLVLHNGETKRRIAAVHPDHVPSGGSLAFRDWFRVGEAYVNLASGDVVHATGRFRALDGSRVMVEEEDVCVVVDLLSGESVPAGPVPDSGGDFARAGQFVAWGGNLYDLRNPDTRKHYPGHALALSPTGRVLTASKGEGRHGTGPLVWRTPE